jgi:putative membrane protein
MLKLARLDTALPIWIPYCGSAPSPTELWGRWNADPLLAVVLIAGLAIMTWRAPQRPFAVAAFAVLAVGFVSPLCALSSALFSARTVHHLLLLCAAAPLLAWSLPRPTHGRIALATLVQTAVFWVWHAPPAYAAAMSSPSVYWLMQLSLLGSAIWFWAAARAAPAPSAVAALLVAMVQMGLLGALITFAGQPLYEPHFASTLAWGLTPLEDQQAAGLIMWTPAAAIYMAAALTLLGRLLGPDQRIGARTA